VGITTDVGAAANLATEILKTTEQLQTEKNTPAMVQAAMAADQIKVDDIIEKAIATNDQQAIQKIAAQ
jgi:hypothetical protein